MCGFAPVVSNGISGTSDVWWTPDRLNHAAIIDTQVLGEREAMGRRMSDAVLDSLGIPAVGPATLEAGDEDDR